MEEARRSLGNVKQSFNQGTQIIHNGRSTYTHIATSRPDKQELKGLGLIKTGSLPGQVQRNQLINQTYQTGEKLCHGTHGVQKHNKTDQGCDKYIRLYLVLFIFYYSIYTICVILCDFYMFVLSLTYFYFSFSFSELWCFNLNLFNFILVCWGNISTFTFLSLSFSSNI